MTAEQMDMTALFTECAREDKTTHNSSYANSPTFSIATDCARETTGTAYTTTLLFLHH